MIEKTMYAIKFYLAHGHVIEIVTEDEGLTKDDFRQDIQTAIDEDNYYIAHDVINDCWEVIKAKCIQAFAIKDVGLEKEWRPFYEEDTFLIH